MQKYGGVSNYIANLIKRIEQKNFKVIVPCLLYKNRYAKNLKIKSISGFFIPDYPKYCAQIIRILNRIYFLLFVLIKKPKLIHLSYYTTIPKIFIPKDCKIILPIYDCIHEKLPEFWKSDSELKAKKNAIKSANFYICISKNTRNDFIKYYKVNKDLNGYRIPKQ